MENVPQQPQEISQDAANFLLRAAEHVVDHLNGTEDPASVLFVRTAIAKAVGND